MIDAIRSFIAEYEPWLITLAWVSAGLLVISLVTLPIVAVLLPADFITRHDPQRPRPAKPRAHPAWYWTARVLKNLFGVFLLAAGLAMLVLPGQGLLTLALAFLMLDLPGKQRFEARLLHANWLQRPINRLRHTFGRPPLDA